MQPLAHGGARILLPGRVSSVRSAIGDMAIDPHRPSRLVLRETHMRNNKRRTGFQPAANMLKCFKPLLDGDVMEGQQADGGIEGAFGRDVDPAFVKTYPPAVLSGDQPCQLQHVGRGVYTVKSPALMRLGKSLELQSAAGAEHEHAAIVGRPLRHQHRRHPVQA